MMTALLIGYAVAITIVFFASRTFTARYTAVAERRFAQFWKD
jgi:ABC-type phosphate/phosphonate transport system permease subunit